MNLKLVQSGSMLVIIPLFVNAIIIALLVATLNQSARLAELERAQTELVEQISMLTNCYYETSGSLITCMLTGNKHWRDRGARDLAHFKQQLKIIEQRTVLTPGQLRATRGIVDFFDSQYKSLGKPSADLVFNLVDDRMKLFEVIKTSVGSSDTFPDFVSPQREILAKLTSEQKQAQKRVGAIVIIGGFLNVVIAGTLLFLLTFSFSRRFKVLVDNAQRLSARMKLNDPLKGADELSYLDGIIHGAAADLHQAAEHRRSVMEMVAHDLRSPLSASQISLEIIAEQEGANLSERGLKQLEKVKANNRRLVGLTKDLLMLDELEMGELHLLTTKFSLRKVVDEAIDSLSGISLAKKIDIDNQAEDLVVNADEPRILQVLINLLSNALKFSKSNSTILISTEVEEQRVTVKVIDQGIGMSGGDARQVFEKFFRSTEGRKAEGFGLGLAICKLIMVAHAEDIGVRSELGKGSCFWFKLKTVKP